MSLGNRAIITHLWLISLVLCAACSGGETHADRTGASRSGTASPDGATSRSPERGTAGVCVCELDHSAAEGGAAVGVTCSPAGCMEPTDAGPPDRPLSRLELCSGGNTLGAIFPKSADCLRRECGTPCDPCLGWCDEWSHCSAPDACSLSSGYRYRCDKQMICVTTRD